MQKLQPTKKFLENINMYKQMHNEMEVICICTVKDNGKIKNIPLEYG